MDQVDMWRPFDPRPGAHEHRTPAAGQRPRTPAATRTGYLRSSSQARQVTRGYLSALPTPPTTATVEEVLLVVSELVTNAFRHAGSVTEFGLSCAGDHLEITVGDNSSALPHEHTPDVERCGGFGWHLVRHFADETNIRLGPGAAKTIRISMPL
ncbi:ATP-binding protein [Streptomyces sp. NPDC059788]|uniref:ATP-binding protein n=1 Tax=Streptomyces sp. NPDC059788 TaxID=3346948 RepID=UPI00365F47EE